MTNQRSNPQATAAPVVERWTPQVGDTAPDFALPDADGTIHRLSDRRGHWTVVYFYPEDDTPGCTTEACQFRDLSGDIIDRSADVWGISPDDAASHRRFREKFGLPFTLLSDVDHEVSKEYGAWGPKVSYGRETIGLIRSTYLVDPDGRVAHAWPKVKADGHAADVLATLREAQAAA
jgi:peroxiredoxin Q/BCP